MVNQPQQQHATCNSSSSWADYSDGPGWRNTKAHTKTSHQPQCVIDIHRGILGNNKTPQCVTYSHGNLHVGSVKNEEPNGWGTMLQANGDTYVGEWLNGEHHGTGTYVFHDMGVFTGVFDIHQGMVPSDNNKTTKCPLKTSRKPRCVICNNGDVYVGVVKNWRPNGWGTMLQANGDKYVGEWLNGEHHGTGTFMFHDDVIFTGVFDIHRGISGKMFYPEVPGVSYDCHDHTEAWNAETNPLRGSWAGCYEWW